jgi:hypothetical protein
MKIKENYLDTKETARYLDIHAQTLWKWRKEKKHLPFIIIAGKFYYDKSDLDAFLNGKKNEL